MSQQHQAKLNWYKLLGALAIFSGTIGTIESRPANAVVSNTQDSLESTQSILENSLERPTRAIELNYSSLDNNTAQPIAKFRRRHRRRGFGGHRRGHRRYGHGRRGFGGHRRGHHRGFKKFF